MSASATPFEDTSVPVSRSQDQIRSLLQKAGALGVSFESTWGDAPRCIVRFVWPLTITTKRVEQTVRLEVTPLAPGRTRRGNADIVQRERQAWRGLAHYLEGTIKAATFGLIRFEDIFLSFLELPDRSTFGRRVMGELERTGRLELPRGDG